MRKRTITYYCDDCKKEIATIEEPKVNEAYDILQLGVFQRPKRSSPLEFPKDEGDLCKNCMLKTLERWTEQVRGH